MKKQIFAVFTDIDVADQAINELHNELSIPADDISYVYRDEDGNKISGDADDVASETPAEGAVSGATTGGVIGAVIGLVASIGVLGPLGPVVVSGPLAAALGLTGAVGATVSAAAVGAAAGGLLGALMSLGVGEPEARKFEERVKAGDVLVHVQADDEDTVVDKLREHNAEEITIIADTV